MLTNNATLLHYWYTDRLCYTLPKWPADARLPVANGPFDPVDIILVRPPDRRLIIERRFCYS